MLFRPGLVVPDRGPRTGNWYRGSAENGSPLCGRNCADSIRRMVSSTSRPNSSPLFVGDGGPEVLDFDQSLANEHDLSDVGDAGHPGVADQLRIESQQALRFLRIPAGSGLPLQQAPGTVQFVRSRQRRRRSRCRSAEADVNLIWRFFRG